MSPTHSSVSSLPKKGECTNDFIFYVIDEKLSENEQISFQKINWDGSLDIRVVKNNINEERLKINQ